MCGFLKMYRTSVLAGLTAMVVASSASAAAVETPAAFKVVQLTIVSTSLGTSNDWFSVDSTATFGSCNKWTDNRTAFIIQPDEQGKRILTMVQSALLSGKPLFVGWDDTKKANNLCIAQWVRIGS
jgi:hypothetical protein